jgi:hypothetical protein
VACLIFHLKYCKQKTRQSLDYRVFVRLKGLEPPRLSAPDPKSGAATNYATAASFNSGAKIHSFLVQANFFESLLFESLLFDVSVAKNIQK